MGHSAGEWVGYLTGETFSSWAYSVYCVSELGRWDHVSERDRQTTRSIKDP